MKEIDLKKIKMDRQYVGGINYGNSASRTYKYTVTEGDMEMIGFTFYSQTHTKKKKNGEWGEGEVIYFESEDSPEYKTPGALLLDKFAK